MSVIVATAYMDEAQRFDWLVAMDAGKVLATGSPPTCSPVPKVNRSTRRSSRCCRRSNGAFIAQLQYRLSQPMRCADCHRGNESYQAVR